MSNPASQQWLIFAAGFLLGRFINNSKYLHIPYLIVEITTAFLLYFSSIWFNPLEKNTTQEAISALIITVFIMAMVAVFFIDLKNKIIPSIITMPLIVCGIIKSFLPNEMGVLQSALGAITGFGLIFLIDKIGTVIYKKPAMGQGDMWLFAAIGSFIGLKLLIVNFFITSILGGAVAVIYLVLQPGKKSGYIAYGPFLSAGAIITIFFGNEIIKRFY